MESEKKLLRNWKRVEGWLQQDSLIYAGFIAIGIVLVQPFVTVDELDVSALICIVAFAIAIPLLAVMTMINHLQKTNQFAPRSRITEFTKGMGLLSGTIGVVAAFWHMSWIAGLALTASGIIGMSAYGAYFAKLPRELGGEGLTDEGTLATESTDATESFDVTESAEIPESAEVTEEPGK